MSWDEWEQLKKQVVERGGPGPDRANATVPQACPVDGVQEARSPGDAPETEAAARRMDRIRNTIDGFRDTTVLVPLVLLDGGGRGFLTADFGGVRWIHAFTDELAAAAFDAAQGAAHGRRDFMAVRGWRLLDVVIPAMAGPCGVALDVGSDDDGVLLPPVEGIVPDAAAVDSGAYGSGGQPW
ncbi:hypothetical protein [Streptomyces sp. NPDC051572]|uniref:hypothetical protein n=1 Tax=unclassified Streptomyces TaxID=2593676 RepID=UPI00344E3051